MHSEQPMVNREYLLSLVNSLYPDLVTYIGKIAPHREIITLDEINRVLLLELCRLNDAKDSHEARLVCNNNQCGKQWFSSFIGTVLPFFDKHKGFYLNG